MGALADGLGDAPAQPAGFLGVSRSISGRRWRARAADEALVREHQARLGLDEPLARALASRQAWPAGMSGATCARP